MKKVLFFLYKTLLTVYVDFWKRFYITMGMLHFCLFDAFMIFNASYDLYYVRQHVREIFPSALGLWGIFVFIRVLLTPAGPREVIVVEDRRKGRK